MVRPVEATFTAAWGKAKRKPHRAEERSIEFFTLSRLADLSGRSLQEIQTDIVQERLRPALSVAPVEARDHHTRARIDSGAPEEPGILLDTRPRLIWITGAQAAELLRGRELEINTARYPIFESEAVGGASARYKVEGVQFLEPYSARLSDLVILEGDANTYISQHTGRPLLGSEKPHRTGKGGSYEIWRKLAPADESAEPEYQQSSAQESPAQLQRREIEFTESVLIGSTRYPAGCRASFTPDDAAEYIWRGWARDPRTGEQGERFTGTTVLRVDDIRQEQGAACETFNAEALGIAAEVLAPYRGAVAKFERFLNGEDDAQGSAMLRLLLATSRAEYSVRKALGPGNAKARGIIRELADRWLEHYSEPDYPRSAGREGGLRPEVSVTPKPAAESRGGLKKSAKQDLAIENALRELGYDPDNLPPKGPEGTPGLRGEVWAKVKNDRLFAAVSLSKANAFRRAWERAIRRGRREG